MYGKTGNGLDFERTSRKDFRVWLAFAIGGVIVIAAYDSLFGSNILRSAPGPEWLTMVMLVAGLAMFVVASICLIFNTSQGCMVVDDTEELIWWQMKFTKQDLSRKRKIKLRDIQSVRIDKSSDGLDVALYDIVGAKQDTFSEALLPPDYEAWIARLIERWPHIKVEVKD
ncbi:hypothetical protein N9M66_00280 [Litoreibacter sp.]|nr:hypothetical protein [Litoreibacter sp.]